MEDIDDDLIFGAAHEPQVIVNGNVQHVRTYQPPLVTAVREGSLREAERLIDADPSLLHDMGAYVYWHHPFYYLLEHDTEVNLQMARLFIAKGMKPDVPWIARTWLRRAIAYGNFTLVKLLVDAGANVHLVTDNGETMLFEAVWNRARGSREMIKYFIDKNVPVNAIVKTLNFPTALHRAVSKLDLETTELLLAHGADVNIPAGSRMQTSLLIGWVHGTDPNRHAHRIPMINILVKHGADLECKDRIGRIPESSHPPDFKQHMHRLSITLVIASVTSVPRIAKNCPIRRLPKAIVRRIAKHLSVKLVYLESVE